MKSIFSKLKSYFSKVNGLGGREGEGRGGLGGGEGAEGSVMVGPAGGRYYSVVCVCPHLVLF